MALRDLFLILLMLSGAFVSLRVPAVAAGFFMWIGLMLPHSFVYGFATQFPWANIFAVVLFFSVLRGGLDKMGRTFLALWPVFLFLAWAALTTTTAFAEAPASERLIYFSKVVLGTYLVACSINTKKDVVIIVAAFAISIGFFGLKGGPWVLMTGASTGSVRGPTGSSIEDNNDIAVALVASMPLIYWFFAKEKIKWRKYFLGFVLAMTMIAVLGTYSRGGFVALGVSTTLLVMKSSARLKIALLLIPALAAGLAFMPEKFWGRMSTIQTYEQDDSANGRINAWITAYRIANDKVLGGGFSYYLNPPEMLKYAPDGTVVRNVHSIFFGALGEHGYIGLILLLIMIAYSLNKTRSYRFEASQARKRAPPPVLGASNYTLEAKKAKDALIVAAIEEQESQNSEFELLRRMVQVSIMAFLAGAAFVNLLYWEGFYYLLVIACIGLPIYAKEESKQTIGKSNRKIRNEFSQPGQSAV
jgi:putative inorganic carbon (hco3(-)) transporter